VHHAPPANSPTSWGGKRFFGDVELVRWIECYQPSMVILGHVHQSPLIPDGSWFDRLGNTWVFNTGRQPSRPPTQIALQIDDGRVFWLGDGEAQHIDLNASLQRPAAPISDPPPWLLFGSDRRSGSTAFGFPPSGTSRTLVFTAQSTQMTYTTVGRRTRALTDAS
jgi:hypothetical protein